MIRNELNSIEPYSEKLTGIYRGVVEDNSSDPLKSGRVKVRIFGLHTKLIDKNDTEGIPTSELPWCEPAYPIFEGSITGVGFFSVPVQGTHVFVFFENGEITQPRYFACVPGMQPDTLPTLSNSGGFRDPDNVYPLTSGLSKPDMNENSVKNYPFNSVLHTQGNLLMEFDSLPDDRRIHLMHAKKQYELMDEYQDIILSTIPWDESGNVPFPMPPTLGPGGGGTGGSGSGGGPGTVLPQDLGDYVCIQGAILGTEYTQTFMEEYNPDNLLPYVEDSEVNKTYFKTNVIEKPFLMMERNFETFPGTGRFRLWIPTGAVKLFLTATVVEGAKIGVIGRHNKPPETNVDDYVDELTDEQYNSISWSSDIPSVDLYNWKDHFVTTTTSTLEILSQDIDARSNFHNRYLYLQTLGGIENFVSLSFKIAIVDDHLNYKWWYYGVGDYQKVGGGAWFTWDHNRNPMRVYGSWYMPLVGDVGYRAAFNSSLKKEGSIYRLKTTQLIDDRKGRDNTAYYWPDYPKKRTRKWKIFMPPGVRTFHMVLVYVPSLLDYPNWCLKMRCNLEPIYDRFGNDNEETRESSRSSILGYPNQWFGMEQIPGTSRWKGDLTDEKLKAFYQDGDTYLNIGGSNILTVWRHFVNQEEIDDYGEAYEYFPEYAESSGMWIFFRTMFQGITCYTNDHYGEPGNGYSWISHCEYYFSEEGKTVFDTWRRSAKWDINGNPVVDYTLDEWLG